jgi:hypothetical protein
MSKQSQALIRKGMLLAGLALPALLSTSLRAQTDTPSLQQVEANWSLLEQYCVGCHNFEDWAGSLAFDTLSPASVADNPAIFEEAIRKMRGRLMPPPGNERPDEQTLDEFVAHMESYLDNVASTRGNNPGHIAIHRLNRREYQNAVKDLLDMDIDAKDLLPADIASDGFDNVANVLQVSPAFLEQYMQAARAISIKAVSAAEAEPDVATFDAPSLVTQYRHVDGLPLGTRGGFAADNYFPADGEYIFNIDIASVEGSLQRSYPTWWLESEHRFILTIDGEEVYTTTLGGPQDEEAVDRLQTPAITAIQERFMDIRLPVKAGTHTIGAAFVARTFAESDRIVDHLSPGEGQDNIPVVVSLKTFGPMNAAGLPDVPSRRKIFSCYPNNNDEERPCAEQLMSELARQAFRRPVNDEDMATLMRFYEDGRAQGGFDVGIQKSIMAMLASTKFLYRAEPLPDDAKPGEGFPVTDMELASRLSFFLWSRGPDEELLSLAEQGKLRETRVLREQVQRMLADPRASALTGNFAFQWLKIDDVDAIDPDPRLFPDFDADLRMAFKQELALFVDSILRDDRSVVDLLDAKHSFLNERLARHYGIDSVRGSQFRRVTLADERRHGLLGKGGLLLLTSYPNRTSPVLRGAYILETLIGTPPAAPPPGVETDLDARAPGEEIKTVRLRLEAHREQPSCNQCHGVIDPLGLALENFNAIGQWQDMDRYARAPIDALGQLATGEPVTGPVDLYRALRERPDQFVQAFTEKLMTFALGRTVEHFDMPIVRSVVKQAAAADYRFAAIVQGIVESPAFQMKSLPSEDHADTTLSMND